MHSDIIDFCCANKLDFKLGAPMREQTTMKVGGECALLAAVPDIASLKELLTLIEGHGEKYFILGRGSNLLVGDSGFDGAAIKLTDDFCAVIASGQGSITAGAGASLKALCIGALENSLTGLEFAYGIPGSVGGAVYMNAGAYGGEMADVVYSVSALEGGEIKTYFRDELDFSYRKSIFEEKKGAVILSAVFSLGVGETSAIEERMNELLKRRRDKQPLEYASAGSTFKRPDGFFAAQLIEECGLKGTRVGDAMVSEKHSGFVVNTGNASFSDVMGLVEIIKARVWQQKGIRLELEPKVID